MIRRSCWRVLWALLALVPTAARACDCLIVYPICNEVHAADAVFIGVAESVQPKFLDYWRTAGGSAPLPLDELSRLRAEGSPAAMEKLRALYLEMAGDLPAQERAAIENAATVRELDDLFNSLSSGGVRTRFRILKNYKADKGDGEEPAPVGFTTVWTDTGECGIHFQTGETYLVYADYDEETGRLRTSICYRTRRLADAGADLAFLYRYEKGGEASSRLEGFVTSERNQDRPTYTNRIRSPVGGTTVALAMPGGQRWFTTSDAEGRFWFDGLAEGEYAVSVFASGYPQRTRELAGPQRVRVPAKGCALDVVTITGGLPLQ